MKVEVAVPIEMGLMIAISRPAYRKRSYQGGTQVLESLVKSLAYWSEQTSLG